MRHLVLAALLACGACAYGTGPDDRTDYVVAYQGQSMALDAAATRTVQRAAEAAERVPSAGLVVAGYADDPGAPEADQIQSRLRAQTVADLLVQRGVARRRIRIEPRRAIGGDPGVESRRVDIRLEP